MLKLRLKLFILEKQAMSNFRTLCLLSFVAMSFFPLSARSGPADPCDCPKLDCDSCEDQMGLTFYSEKCGENRVRSCSRPSCKLKDPLPSGCEFKQKSTPSASQEVKSSYGGKENPDEKASRSIASQRGEKVGSVSWSKGSSWLLEPSGIKHEIRVGEQVHLKDKVKTDRDGELKIVFQDSNELHVQVESEILMSEYESNAKLNRRALLDLIKGKVRSKVKQKYKGDTSSYYKVRTKSAVAGVRGTDFVVSFNFGDKEITKIETLKGAVVLANSDESESMEVPKGTSASYVVEASNSEVFSKEEISEFVARGYMTPLHHMTAEEIEKLNWSTEVGEKSAREVASSNRKKSNGVCQSPQASINDCYWACENNPKGEKICRTDLPQVNCIRKRCNANGDWAEETRLPASFQNQCHAEGVRVGSCDY